mmetsp:Transcript_14066/g.26334  ORF Transcript_14066/g.26334 Transcript_14066/m.26334 type:complete len:167 (-) Transcript_14066:1777-2277(-)
MISQPTLIEEGNLRFLLTDTPSRHNIEEYVEILKRSKAVLVVRACEQLYDDEQFDIYNIKPINLYFRGNSPPSHIVKQWLKIVRGIFNERNVESNPCIAVHCMSGLGRAPTLVAIALIDAGMECSAAVELIKRKRSGSLNENHIYYLKNFASNKRLHPKAACCILQ